MDNETVLLHQFCTDLTWTESDFGILRNIYKNWRFVPRITEQSVPFILNSISSVWDTKNSIHKSRNLSAFLFFPFLFLRAQWPSIAILWAFADRNEISPTIRTDGEKIISRNLHGPCKQSKVRRRDESRSVIKQQRRDDSDYHGKSWPFSSFLFRFLLAMLTASSARSLHFAHS